MLTMIVGTQLYIEGTVKTFLQSLHEKFPKWGHFGINAQWKKEWLDLEILILICGVEKN